MVSWLGMGEPNLGPERIRQVNEHVAFREAPVVRKYSLPEHVLLRHSLLEAFSMKRSAIKCLGERCQTANHGVDIVVRELVVRRCLDAQLGSDHRKIVRVARMRGRFT